MATRFVCNTPEIECTGHSTLVSEWQGGGRTWRKTHSDRKQAWTCYRAYLIRVEGYQETETPNEMRKPGSPILILTRVSRYGAELRTGKLGRVMPKIRNGGIIKG